MFATFERTALKLEVRRNYRIPSEDHAFQEFLEGRAPGTDWLQPWLDLVAAQTAAGKRIKRIRIVDNPPSDYLRFEMAVTPHNLRAGEDIRYLSRRRVTTLALPDYDFWLLDAHTIVDLHFTDDDRYLGYTTTTAPHLVA
ncbi:DUF6879 family protein [Micromonospora sp. SH-82]|uniref:DUF6879 family protein n=1 Tax=Micromonospora sp. SH-82 TaxID=3132938 RepID=UPI003EBD9120